MIKNIVFFFVCLLQIQPLFGAISWSPPSLLCPEGVKCGSQAVSVNSQGNTIIGRVNCQDHVIELAEYHFALDRFDAPTITYPCSSKDVKLLKMLLLDNEDIFLLWEDKESVCLQASKYDRSLDAWTETFVASSKKICNPDLKVDVNGNAMLIWTKSDQYVHQIQASYFSAQKNNWSSVVSISPVGYNCQSQALAFDQQGNVVVCWSFDLYSEHDKENSTQGIQAIKFNAAQEKWSSSPFITEFSISDKLIHPDLMFDSKGNVFISWEHINSYMRAKTIQYIYYDFSKKEFANKIDILAQSSPYKSSLVKSNNRVFAIWQTNSFGKESLQSLPLSTQSNHQVPADISSPLSTISHYNLETDGSGRIAVAFSDHQQIKIAQFDKVWQDIGKFDNQTNISNLQIENDALGNMLVVWEKNGQAYYSRGNHLLSPSSFSATRREKQFATKKVTYIELNWTHPESPALAGYKIRKNDVVIAELPAGQTTFIDPIPLFRGYTIYSITSMNDRDMESQTNEIVVSW